MTETAEQLPYNPPDEPEQGQQEAEPEQQTVETVTLANPDESLSRDFETDDPGTINTQRALGWATTEEHEAGRNAAAAQEEHLASMYDDIGTEQVNTVSTEGTAGSSQDETSQETTE